MKSLMASVLLLAASGAHADDDAKRWPTLGPAAKVPHAAAAPILSAAQAGSRVVAVGDNGVILLADDGGKVRQATSVPTRTMLTTVQFVDDRRGFAAGHDGVVLSTQDGGESWTLLRATPGAEQPVLSLLFDSPTHGIAVGLYGWAAETNDGGRTWADRHIGSEDDDRHLFHLFKSRAGTWLIAAEQGTVLRSADQGASWQTVATGGLGSLWYGQALADGTLLACGMRGHIYRSTDDGRSWQRVESGTTQSLTSVAQMPDGSVVVVGMNGTVLRSNDGGATFTSRQREHGEPITYALPHAGKLLLYSMVGALPDEQGAP